MAHERAVLSETREQRTQEQDERRATALWRLGESLYRLRQLSDALEPLEAAEEAARALPGWEQVRLRSRCVRAACLVGLQRWAEALALTEELVEVRGTLSQAYYVQRALAGRVVALTALDRWQEAALAAAALRKSLPAEPSLSAKRVLIDAMWTQAWAAGRAGDPESGLVFADEAIALAIESQSREPLSRALSQRAELLYAAGRTPEARETLQAIVDTFRDDNEDFAISAVASARGRRAAMRIRPRRRHR